MNGSVVKRGRLWVVGMVLVALVLVCGCKDKSAPESEIPADQNEAAQPVSE